MLIGLTGKYCAGKNYVASLLEKRGFAVLDVDKFGYKALESEKEAVFTQFGSDLRKPDGSLDRRLLGKRVFGNPEKLAALEAIVHPIANRLTEKWIAEQRQNCVINAALLHRSSVFNRLDKIILVKAPLLTRFIRAKRRDKLPCLAILRRFASQRNFNAQYLAVNAEIYIVDNFTRRKKLESRINMFLERIT